VSFDICYSVIILASWPPSGCMETATALTYNVTCTRHIGLHEIGYHITAYNLDVPLDSQTVSIDPLVVAYKPVYTQYPYPLLSEYILRSRFNSCLACKPMRYGCACIPVKIPWI